jgi:membrane fusion protein, multidrug efflux system
MSQNTTQNTTGKTGGQTMLSRRGYIILAAMLVIIGGAVIIAFTSRQSEANVTGPQRQPTAVEVTPVSLADVADVITGVGNIVAMRDVSVASETAGRVLRVHVEVGDVVKAGTTLVDVDAELKVAAAEQAKAQLLAAQTNLEKAKKDFERTQKLFESGDVADNELEGYRLAYHAADAQYKGAAAALRVAERQVNDTHIKAPIAGIVAARKTEVGEMVAPGMEIANIVDISSIKVKLSVAEADVVKLRVGQHATLRIDSRPADRFVGRIATVGAKSESPNGHTYPVEVVVQNTGKDPLKVGMFARVEIQAGLAKGVMAIAKESLVEDGAHPTVFVVKDGHAQIRQLTLGIRGNNLIHVMTGLQPGDLVISFGQRALKDGAPVQFKQ